MLRPRILVVDDSDGLRTILARALMRQGYDVLTARTGREALARFAADQPDAVVLDLDLPELPGWEVCRLLKRRSSIPIIIMTGDAELELATHHMTSAAAAHLLKPFSLEQLFETLQRALDAPRQRELDRAVRAIAQRGA